MRPARSDQSQPSPSRPRPSRTGTGASSIQWRVWLALAIALIVMALNLVWPWGVLILLWIIPTMFSGTTFFVEEVRRAESPYLFWALTLTWLASGVYLIALPFLQEVTP